MLARTLLALCATILPIRVVRRAAVPHGGRGASDRSVEVADMRLLPKWVDHLEKNGFAVHAKNTTTGMLQRIKRQAGIGEKLASCHTALIDGYAIEGHVPAEDIERLLTERPDAIGLAVPEMPLGSPGMEQPDGTTEPYDVLLVKKDGSTEIFAKH